MTIMRPSTMYDTSEVPKNSRIHRFKSLTNSAGISSANRGETVMRGTSAHSGDSITSIPKTSCRHLAFDVVGHRHAADRAQPRIRAPAVRDLTRQASSRVHGRDWCRRFDVPAEAEMHVIAVRRLHLNDSIACEAMRDHGHVAGFAVHRAPLRSSFEGRGTSAQFRSARSSTSRNVASRQSSIHGQVSWVVAGWSASPFRHLENHLPEPAEPIASVPRQHCEFSRNEPADTGPVLRNPRLCSSHHGPSPAASKTRSLKSNGGSSRPCSTPSVPPCSTMPVHERHQSPTARVPVAGFAARAASRSPRIMSSRPRFSGCPLPSRSRRLRPVPMAARRSASVTPRPGQLANRASSAAKPTPDERRISTKAAAAIGASSRATACAVPPPLRFTCSVPFRSAPLRAFSGGIPGELSAPSARIPAS
ncbi:hypothetical protein 2.28 [Burkholderia phage Bups phi1]|nr:hypothetical protein 2.28 [Burkholderia phage Bups phi1]